MKYLVFLFSILVPVSLWTQVPQPSSVNGILAWHDTMDQLFARGEYDRALDYYRIFQAKVREFPSAANYLAKSRENIPFDRIIQARKKLGDIKPAYTHHILVLYIKEACVDTFAGSTVDLRDRLSAEQLKKLEISQGVFQKYVEVLSKGQWSVRFTRWELDAGLSHVFHVPGHTGGPVPDIHSISPWPGERLLSILDQVDSVLIYYPDKHLGVKRSYGGIRGIPLVPYQLESPPRGYLRLNSGHDTAYTLLHEWWHAVEDMYGIRPYHAFKDELRQHYPGWQGSGQWSYYQWHMDHTISTHPEWIRFSNYHPFVMSRDVFEKNRDYTKALTVQEQRQTLLDLRRAEAVKKPSSRKKKRLLQSVIKINPFHYQALFQLGRWEYLFGNKDLSKHYILRAYAVNAMDTGINYWMGIHANRDREAVAAVRYMTKSIQYDPRNAAAYFYRGTLYFRLKDYEACFQDSADAITLDPLYKQKAADWYGRLNDGAAQDILKELDG